MPQPHDRVRELFLAACERPPDEREAYVRLSSGDDCALRDEVLTLLRHNNDAASGAALGKTSAGATPAGVAEPTRPASHGPKSPRSGIARDSDHGFTPGTVIANRYRISALLGRGGMGEVYRADDLALDQPVALKYLMTNLSADATWLDRFRHEVRVARQISHANLCRVYDIGDWEGEHFISMEYIDGENLAALQRRIGRLPADKALDIAHQICAGLAAAHAKGVLHRDLKPANIMLDSDGRVRITDFGLAGHREEIGADDVQAGTPAYMAPEQLAGRDVSVRSDVFALGLVLYELFTGRPAFEATSVADLMHQYEHKIPSSPSTLHSDIDPLIERVILQCLERDPRRRPASALAVAAALPGGDVLAIAVSAGQTPSPELIAAAGGVTGLGTCWCIYALAAFIAMLVAIVLMPQTGHTPDWRSCTESPTVLAHRARELLSTLGYGANAGDSAYGLSSGLRCDLVDTITPAGERAVVDYATTGRSDVVFWYRQSETRLMPNSPANLIFGRSRVLFDDPPPVYPGSRRLTIDPDGRLLGYEHIQHLYEQRDGPPRAPDWPSLFAAAGLDLKLMQPAEPRSRPRTYADTRVAWTGPHPDRPEQRVYVEGAAFRDQPVLFAVLSDKLRLASALQSSRETFRRRLVDYSRTLIVAALLIGALPLARANVRSGRGDVRGALRVAAAIFGIRLTAWLLLARHAADFDQEWTLVVLAVLGALGEATMVGLFYAALEPYVRRFWPHTLISWSRLLAGRISDPLVGRDLLLGAVLGSLWALALLSDWHVTHLLGLRAREVWRDREAFLAVLSGRYALGVGLDALRHAIYEGLFVLLLLVMLRVWLKRPALASLATVLLIAPMFVPRGTNPAVSWLMIGLVCIGAGVWALQRFGPLPVMIGVLVCSIYLLYPMTFDTGAWYADTSFFAIIALCAIAVYGFIISRRCSTATDCLLARSGSSLRV